MRRSGNSITWIVSFFTTPRLVTAWRSRWTCPKGVGSSSEGGRNLFRILFGFVCCCLFPCPIPMVLRMQPAELQSLCADVAMCRRVVRGFRKDTMDGIEINEVIFVLSPCECELTGQGRERGSKSRWSTVRRRLTVGR